MKKLVDPFLLAGIVLLIVFDWSGKWLTFHPMMHPARGIVLAVDWVSGIGGIVCVMGGVIRAVVRVALDGRYILGALFYCGFWLLLASPLILMELQGGDSAPAGALWFCALRLLFPIMGALTLVAYFLGRYFKNRRAGLSQEGRFISR